MNMRTPAITTRRRFLQSSMLAVAGTTVGAFDGRWAFAAGSSVTPDWVDKPMRWAQLTLVEDDPGKFDPRFWLDYFKRTRSDAVCLSAGGCVAYYPTRGPFHHRSQWLCHSDPFARLTPGRRKLGRVLIPRHNVHAASAIA